MSNYNLKFLGPLQMSLPTQLTGLNENNKKTILTLICDNVF